MCGIGGFVLNKNKSFSEDYIDILKKMSSKQKTGVLITKDCGMKKVKEYICSIEGYLF